jgi:Fic family protein
LPRVADANAAALRDVDRLLRHRALRARGAQVTAESTLRSGWASARLSGANTSLAALRAELTHRGTPTGPDDRLVAGAIRLYAQLGYLQEVWTRAPRQALARMHALAARGTVPDSDLGRPRADREPLLHGESALPDLPHVEEVAARLEALVQLLATTEPASALVLAAVVHAELLAVRPFPSANGLVARAASRLVLVSRGVDPKAVTMPEVGHLELRDEYETLAARYAGGDPGVVGSWIAHCARCLALGAREGLAVCEALQRG